MSRTLQAIGCLVLVLSVSAGVAHAGTPEEDLRDANQIVQRALTSARAGDLATAKQAYDQYENTWFVIEDPIGEKSRAAYVSIERAMTDVLSAFAVSPPDRERVVQALTTLDREHQAFITGAAPAAPQPSTQATSTTRPTVATLLDQLATARAALARSDYPAATAQLKQFESTWLDVEGEIKTRSADAYRATENDMALASTLAASGSPNASEVVERMATRLEPYRESQRYGIFDAAVILLREGLEALLVVVALSTFLKKSGNTAGQPWLWGGVAAGLVLSIALGLAIQAFFSAIVNPSNRELMEGLVGLVAAAMLVYVSYWLHSKASLKGWQNYVSERTQQAIKGGRLVGLAALAFLAVFREGAETALFYLGMVSNISTSDLLIGLGLATVALAILAVLMVVAGLRIPMRPFFTVASVLVFYLCFKFVGTGVHALQVAGYIPSGSAEFLPSFDLIGMYPTWPTMAAQAVLLVAAVAVVLRERVRVPGSAVRRSIPALLLTIGIAGCAPAAPTQPAPTAPAKAAAAVPAAPALQSGRKEATLVAGPRKRLEETLVALQRNDVPAARVAFAAFDSDWNGIEVYVNVRSRELYGEVETKYQADIEKGLEATQPNAAELAPQVQAMIGKYDEAIRLSDTGAPLSPLFDDVATVRIVRAPLRTVSPALKSGDSATAKTGFSNFKSSYPQAQPLLAARSEAGAKEVDAALAEADRAMAAPTIDAATAGPLIDRLMERFNFGLNLLNAAARNADPAKTAFTPEDMKLAAGLGKLQQQLQTSLTAWESGNYSSAAEIARTASTQQFDPAVSALQAKSAADAAPKKALDTYVGLAGQAGDREQVRTANKAAMEAVAIGQQALVGQFWTDTAFRTAYAAALAAP